MRGGFLGGMTAEKYSKITGTSNATATRYAINVKGWTQPTPEDCNLLLKS